jgi:hypothetical protein
VIFYIKASFSVLKGFKLFSLFDATEQKTAKVYDFINTNFGEVQEASYKVSEPTART